MPGFSIGDSFSDQGSFGNSSSVSGSIGSSSGNSSATSGYALTPQQQAWLSALYPQLAGQYSALSGTNPQALFQQAQGSFGKPQDFSAYATLDPNAPAYQQITQGPIWNDKQIQDRVNAARANSTAETQGKIRDTAEQLSGRGYGANSPLQQALATNLQGQNLAQNTQGENDLRWNAAQGNAQHVLQTQQAEDAAQQMQSQDTQSRFNLGSAALLARQQAAAQNKQALGALTLGRYNTDVGAQTSRQNALLAALNSYTQPHPFSNSTSSQKSFNASASRSNSNQGSGAQSGSNNLSEQWDTGY